MKHPVKTDPECPACKGFGIRLIAAYALEPARDRDKVASYLMKLCSCIHLETVAPPIEANPITDWADETRIRGGLLALGQCLRRTIRKDMIEARVKGRGQHLSPELSESCAKIELESHAALSLLVELKPLASVAAQHISRLAAARCKGCLAQAQDCARTPGRKCCPDCTHESGWTIREAP